MLDHLDLEDRQALGLPDLQECQVHRDRLGPQGHLDLSDHPGYRAYQDLSGLLAPLDRADPQDLQERSRDRPDLLDL